MNVQKIAKPNVHQNHALKNVMVLKQFVFLHVCLRQMLVKLKCINAKKVKEDAVKFVLI